MLKKKIKLLFTVIALIVMIALINSSISISANLVVNEVIEVDTADDIDINYNRDSVKPSDIEIGNTIAGIGGDSFLRDKYLYCLNHGLTYAAYTTFVCIDNGSLDNIFPEIPYIVEQQKDYGSGKRDQYFDIEANAIWTLVNDNYEALKTEVVDAAQTLINEARASLSLKEEGGNISLTVRDENGKILTPDNNGRYNEVFTENEDGTYGNFEVTYPSFTNEETGSNELLGDLKIYVNGKEYTKLPESGEKFGFGIEDGVNLGEYNQVKVTYSATKYSGNYAILKPIVTQVNQYRCRWWYGDNYHYFNINIRGYFIDGSFIRDQDLDFEEDSDSIDIECPVEDCPEGNPIDYLGTYYKYGVEGDKSNTNFQDIIYIETEPTPIEEEIEIEFFAGRPDIEINFNKINTEENRIDGAEFQVAVQNGTIIEGSSNITTSSNTSNKIVIEPAKAADEVTVTFTEINAPEEYAILEEPIVITYKWDNTNRIWVSETKDFTFATGEDVTITQEMSSRTSGKCVDRFTIKAENRRKIIVNLLKTDNGSNILPNMTFDIKVSGGTCEERTVTTNSAGRANFMIIPDGTDDVTLTLTEHSDKFYMDMDPIVITFRYRNGSWQPTVDASIRDQVSIDGAIAEFDLDIINKAKIENLRLVKLNKSVLGEVLPGVTFRITLDNAKTLTGTQFMTATTDNNGEINLGILEVIDPNEPISVTLEEVSVPNDGLNYNGLYTTGESVTITFNHKEAGCKVDNKLIEAEYDLTTNIVNVEISNIVTMDLVGMVWLDGQTGLKPVKAPNGAKDSSEPGIAGVDVKLIREDGIQINTAKTDNNGNYKFVEVPASIKGTLKYYIVFTYNGIDYIATEPGIDSDATEVNRDAFNDRFKTITKDTATGKNGEKISLKYNYNNNDAILETTENGVLKAEFAMSATTMPTTYNKNTNNIDLGLMKKGVDLAVVTDIYEAKVSINGEDKIYDYNDIMQLEKDENDNPILDNVENENVKYNLYLYNSDYNYRIGDYKLSGVKDETLTVNKNNASTNLQNQRQEDGILNVEATYQILLNNQTATEATINQIAYYYDTKYILKDILTEGVTTVGNPELVTIDGTTYNKVILNVNQEFTDKDNQGVIEIVFTIGKDANGNVYTGLMQNWVEIISYSTNSGCIDKDSAPDNIETHKPEDDTDDAAGLNVQLNHIEREVTGYVFDDKKSNNPGQYNIGNGKYDDGENKIDDVIVQLIEIKNVTVGNTTLRLEYIWQETVSGSDKVTYVTIDGKSKGEYSVTNEPGQYTFKQNIIPGDYIVRFVYGDDTYYDSDSAANLLKYNGQDYKSTKDIYYNKTWHTTSYPENSSMARDNEARRLEVMAYATGITANEASNLKIDTQEELKNTWMCAETSLIAMKVSDAEVEGDKVNAIERTINLGLVERPRAYLVLDKHITGLKITGIVEGTTKLANYDNANGKVELTYNSGAGILATPTSKLGNTIGDWTVETDTDAIGGKRLDITYSYRISNIGDADYIGEALKNQLVSGKTYSQIAEEVKSLSSNTNYIPGTYLGTAYYSGEKTTDVVASIPFQVEDYMGVDEGLELDTTSDFKVAGTNVDKNIWAYENTNSSERNPVISSEKVNVIQTKNILQLYANQQTYFENPLTLKVYDASLDSTSTRDDFTYRSYAAQLIYPTTGKITSDTGSLCDGNITLGNLNTVKTYVEESAVSVSEVVPEDDETIAETVLITMNTGDDKTSPVMLIISITAGLTVVAVGVVLIKKFIIK